MLTWCSVALVLCSADENEGVCRCIIAWILNGCTVVEEGNAMYIYNLCKSILGVCMGQMELMNTL